MAESISQESFNEALKTIQRIRSKYVPQEGQDYYSNPEAALDPNGEYFLAPLMYWWRDAQELTQNQALTDAIRIVTRHCRDHYHNKGDLEAFETIIQPVADDAVRRLNETETPKLPMIYRQGVEYFVSALRNNPYYAIGFLAQSTEALADPRNGVGDNQANIQKILNYVVPYYRDRAPVDQAGLMLFALDQAIQENPMGYSSEAIQGLRDHLETIQNNTKNRTEEEFAEITALRANLREVQNACDVIKNGNFQSHPDFIRAGTVLAALNNNQTSEIKTANLANPGQWIFGTSIQTDTLAAFFQVMENVDSQDTLSADVKTALQTLRTFSDDVLSSWASKDPFNNSGEFQLNEAIASHQSTFAMMASAALLEETIEGLQGLQGAVRGSARRDSEGQQRLIDYIVALSRKQPKSHASQDQDLDTPILTLQAKLLEMLKENVDSLVLLEKSRADASLSSAEKEALERVYEDIYDHYQDKSWFLIGLQALRAKEAAPALKTFLGLETLPAFLSELERAEIDAPWEIQNGDDVHGVEKWLLNDSLDDAAKVMFLGSMYGAILQDFIQKDPNAPAAKNARTVLTYIQDYFEAGGKSSEFNLMTTEYFKPILDFAKTNGQEEAFLRALTDVVKAGELWRHIDDIVMAREDSDPKQLGLNVQMGTCITSRYIVADQANLFEIAKQNDESQSPVVSVAILQDHYALKGIKDLLPRIEENPKTALWDTARWLDTLRRQREDEDSDVHQNPEVHRAAERIEAYIRGKFLETSWWLKLDTLVNDMDKPRKASYSFDANGLLDNLCRDDVNTKTLDPAKYASLILEMQGARDHGDLDDDDPDGANKQSDAKVLLPFLSQAIDRFPEFRSQVDREKTRIQEFIAASAKVSFSKHPEFNDKNGLRNALNSDYKMIQYAVMIKDVIDDIDAGVISASSKQRQDALAFQNHVQKVIEGKRWDKTQPYQKYQRISRENIALSAIVDADLPEFNEIQGALCQASIMNCDHVFRRPSWDKYQFASYGGSYSYSQEKLPNLAAKVLFATERALSRRDNLPPRLVQHLEVLQYGINAHWEDWRNQGTDSTYYSDYLRQHEAFNGVVEALVAQEAVLEASQNPKALETATALCA